MVSKPGVFVLAILLAIILVLGVFIYDPQVTNDKIEMGSTLNEVYTNFTSATGYKTKYDSLINNTIAQIEDYKINGGDYKTHIEKSLQELEQAYQSYKKYPLEAEHLYDDETANAKRIEIANQLSAFSTTIINAVQMSANKTYAVLTTKSNLDLLETTSKNGQDFIKRWIDRDKISEACQEFENQYLNTIKNCVNNLIFTTLPNSILLNYTQKTENSRLTIIENRLAKVNNQIEELYVQAAADATIEQEKQMVDLCNKYINIANSYINLVNYELLTNAFSFVGTKTQLNTLYLSTENQFAAKTNLIRYSYIFEHELSEKDFAKPLTIGTTSNDEKNGYDYAYFILKLFSFVIIAYAIMSACHAIAGEVKEGTMRYLAIRPVNRTKILFGKMLAIIFMSAIFAIFSAVIALIVGGITYGLNSAVILTIFNGTKAITLHPIVMLLIYIISMLIELTIYVSIALLLSCLLKSDLLAVTLMLMLYLLNVLIPAFVSNPTSWLAFYPFSHISIYSLFGSSIFATNDNFLNVLLSAKIFTNSSLLLTIIVILTITIIVNFISTYLFNKKEL